MPGCEVKETALLTLMFMQWHMSRALAAPKRPGSLQSVVYSTTQLAVRAVPTLVCRVRQAWQVDS